VEDEIQVPIRSDQDIVTARQKGRGLATALNFSSGDATLIALAISELARNIVTYAKQGEIRLKAIGVGSARQGIQVVAHDDGPGIDDVDQALNALRLAVEGWESQRGEQRSRNETVARDVAQRLHFAAVAYTTDLRAPAAS